MRTVYGFLMMLLISGCSLDPIEEETSDPETVEVERVGDNSEIEGRGDRSGCGLYGSMVRSGPDGIRLIIPVECNPYYFDKGDPDPTLIHKAEEVGRPTDTEIPIKQKFAPES